VFTKSLSTLSPNQFVAKNGDCRRKVFSPFSATVAVFGDSRTFLRQCGQGLSVIVDAAMPWPCFTTFTALCLSVCPSVCLSVSLSVYYCYNINTYMHIVLLQCSVHNIVRCTGCRTYHYQYYLLLNHASAASITGTRAIQTT